MSIAFEETTRPSQYLEQLQNAECDTSRKLDWLVVTYNDSAMIQKLKEFVGEKEMEMLEAPRGSEDVCSESMIDAVTWAIESAAVDHLLLVGHSWMGPESNGRLEWREGESTASKSFTSPDMQTSYDRLIKSAAKTQAEIQHAKESFAAHVNRYREIESIRSAVDSGRLRMYSLFYLAQSGTFLVFDAARQCYVAIGE